MIIIEYTIKESMLIDIKMWNIDAIFFISNYFLAFFNFKFFNIKLLLKLKH